MAVTERSEMTTLPAIRRLLVKVIAARVRPYANTTRLRPGVARRDVSFGYANKLGFASAISLECITRVAAFCFTGGRITLYRVAKLIVIGRMG
jgi:hypothetical protein